MASSGFTGLLMHGAGPFKRLWLDLSDGKGNPHLGPHVIAGVNGSGKSTILKGMAWAVAGEHIHESQFPAEQWVRSLHESGADSLVYWQSLGQERAAGASRPMVRDAEFPPARITDDLSYRALPDSPLRLPQSLGGSLYEAWRCGEWPAARENTQMLVAGYAPTRVLKHLQPGALMPAGPESGERRALSFDDTVENVSLQSWLKELLSRIGLVQLKGEPSTDLELVRTNIEKALQAIFERPAQLDVETSQGFELRFRLGSQSLDFSQLPDGVRNLLAWIVDFARRRETTKWSEAARSSRPGVLMIDEVDAHLHPKWQRTLLPALRAAFPDVQIIVTTHSPFVISSCEEARVHVLDVAADGFAYLKESMDAPVGESIMATIKDIFGVSWYSVEIEKKLRRWNDLKKAKAIGWISREEDGELVRLISELSDSSDELALLVGPLGEVSEYDLPRKGQ